jgi:hypothetical protein
MMAYDTRVFRAHYFITIDAQVSKWTPITTRLNSSCSVIQVKIGQLVSLLLTTKYWLIRRFKFWFKTRINDTCKWGAQCITHRGARDLNYSYSIYWVSQIKILITPTFKCINENKSCLQNFGVDTWGQPTTIRYNWLRILSSHISKVESQPGWY